MARRWKVVGHCALFTSDTAQGPMQVTVYRGHMVPDGAKPEQIRHNAAMGLIRPVGEDPQPAGVADPAPGVPPNPAEQPEGLSEERQAAQAKLPADGSAPHPNAAEATWVEYAVVKGYDYEAATAAGKAELVKLFKG